MRWQSEDKTAWNARKLLFSVPAHNTRLPWAPPREPPVHGLILKASWLWSRNILRLRHFESGVEETWCTCTYTCKLLETWGFNFNSPALWEFNVFNLMPTTIILSISCQRYDTPAGCLKWGSCVQEMRVCIVCWNYHCGNLINNFVGIPQLETLNPNL